MGGGERGGDTAAPDAGREECIVIELKLPDMTCGHCVRTVTATVQRVDAEAKVEVDLAEHRVRIESNQPAQAFATALADEGYPSA